MNHNRPSHTKEWRGIRCRSQVVGGQVEVSREATWQREGSRGQGFHSSSPSSPGCIHQRWWSRGTTGLSSCLSTTGPPATQGVNHTGKGGSSNTANLSPCRTPGIESRAPSQALQVQAPTSALLGHRSAGAHSRGRDKCHRNV